LAFGILPTPHIWEIKNLHFFCLGIIIHTELFYGREGA